MTVDALKEAIGQLSASERDQLTSWLMSFETNDANEDSWDRQMAADFSPTGRAAKLMQRLENEIDRGNFRPLDEGLQSRQRTH